MAAWEPFVAAAFAPVVVWLLWRVQTLSVELLRLRLLVLTRWRGTRWIYSIVSWFGVFLHEASHATVLLLSGHGLSQFRAGVEQGHVLPARIRRGPVGFLSFLAAALAPLFVPPLLVLLGLLFLVDIHLIPWAVPDATLTGAVDALRNEFVAFPLRLARAVANLDLASWPHAVVAALIVVGMPSSRPSHVKASGGSRFHGTEDEGDVPVLRRRIREQPWIFVVFLALLYAAFFLTTAVAAAGGPYWYTFEALWGVAVTGIALALGGAVLWSVAGLMGRTKAVVAWLPPVLFVAGETLLRGPSLHLTLAQVNLLAAGAWAAAALLLALLFPRR